jgi:hypothetical protein
MIKIIILSLLIFTTGCATRDQMYYDAAKSISKDNTMTQTACWASVTEMAKSEESSVRIAALALARECKSDAPKIEPPKKNILGF